MEEQLQYRITFPQEGTYKIWGTFYLNDKKYKQEFIVQVQKAKKQLIISRFFAFLLTLLQQAL